MQTYRITVNEPATVGIVRAFLKPHTVRPQLVLEGEVLGVSRGRHDGRAVFLPSPALAPLLDAGAAKQEGARGEFWTLPPERRWWRVLVQRPLGAQHVTVVLTPATSEG